MEPLLREEYYTYEDYLTWFDDKRRELINGTVYLMSPAPYTRHQDISGALFNQLYSYLEGKECKVYHAPFDVRLNADTTDDTVVQPDIVVLCDKTKLDRRGCKGAPDMVAEIISKSSRNHDRKRKLELYRTAGVKEYWIIDPDKRIVEQCLLKNGRYEVTAYPDYAVLDVTVLDGCEIELEKVFDNMYTDSD